jgi:carboxylesterase type B
MFDWQDGHPDEDCLNLNIWTPGLDDGASRPVMVWLHGGGFEAGSAHELAAYDGENLSRGGDVVVISLNHRLGVLGFLAVSQDGLAKWRLSQLSPHCRPGRVGAPNGRAAAPAWAESGAGRQTARPAIG